MSTKDEAKRFVRGRGYRLKDLDAAQDFFFLMAAFADEQAKTPTSLLQEARELLERSLRAARFADDVRLYEQIEEWLRREERQREGGDGK